MSEINIGINNYRDPDFGIDRVVGIGEGTEYKNRSDSMHQDGAFQQIVVDIDYERDGSLPTYNVGEVFGKNISGVNIDQVIYSVVLKVQEIDAAWSGTIDLANYDASTVITGALGTAVSITSGFTGFLSTENVQGGTELETVDYDHHMKEKMFPIFTGDFTGTKFRGTLIIKYI